ncbi:MAG TPA: hypothetical protein VGC42_17625, partial [Kofleriaceae bacterium]
MNRIKTTSSLFTAVLAAGLLAAPGCATSDDDGDGLGPDESVETAALTAISCGPTASDTAIANELKSVWGGNLTGARIACGRRVVAEVAKRGLSQRAAEIATETILVESGMQNLDGGDRDSVGLFQQRAGWGTFAQRTNPEHATDAFLDEMLRIYPNNSWASKARGTVAQGVQRSAFPDRYEAQTSNAIAIVAKLWGGAASTGWDEVVRADLDGNGNDELGFYTKRDGTFSWYPMATDGKLGTRLSSATIGTSWDVVLGIDADGDGADSVGFYDATSGAYAVYVASNAGVLGTKRSQTTLSTGWTSVVAADFTGDSKDEVAFYNSKTGGYAVYATNTDGSLASSLSTTTLGTGWTSVVATDVTGDGHPELVFYNATNGAYAVYAVTATG